MFETFISQTKVLTRKNIQVLARNRRYMMIFLLTPILSVLYVNMYERDLRRVEESSTIKDFPKNILGEIPKCQEPKNCVTVGYFAFGEKEPWMDPVMKSLAASTGMVFGEDVKYLGKTNPDGFKKFINEHQNQTQSAIIFCTDTWDVHFKTPKIDQNNDTEHNSDFQIPKEFDFKIPCKFNRLSKEKKLIFYSIAYNQTLGFFNPYFTASFNPYPTNSIAVSLKYRLDEALITYFGLEPEELKGQKPKIDKNFEYEIDQQPFPKYTLRFDRNKSFVANCGSFFFSFPMSIGFLIMVTEILNEKDKKLKEYLIFSGMKNVSYWASWMSISISMSLYISISMVTLGTLVGWELFQNIPARYMLGYYFFSSFGMFSLGFLLAALCTNAKSGYSVAYSFLLISFVFQCFLTDPTAMEFLYIKNTRHVVITWMRLIFEYYPGFNYIKIWSDFVYIGDKHMKLVAGTNVDGRKFEVEDFYKVRETVMPSGKLTELTSPFYSFYNLLFNIGWMLALGWVVDNLQIPNQTVNLRTLLCMSKKKNMKKVRKAKKVGRGRIDSEEVLSDPESVELSMVQFGGGGADRSVKDETEKTMAEMRNWKKFDGLLCDGVSKVYKKYPFGIKSKFDVQALKSVFMRVESGELLSILGQNGAGKTTLMNCLTGQLIQSIGRIKIFGLDLKQDNEEVKEIVSMCPQFDIYWNDLSVYEHLALFASIRGVEQDEVDEVIKRLIRDVDLWDRRDHKITQLSGGMKRRLSIAISTLGDPRIIFLDEPTTGLDPVTQREVMKLIEVSYP
jgi:ABC-type Na+ transport system ATPase subunit NatA